MHTLEIMQFESASITLIFQRLAVFCHSITSYFFPISSLYYVQDSQSNKQARPCLYWSKAKLLGRAECSVNDQSDSSMSMYLVPPSELPWDPRHLEDTEYRAHWMLGTEWDHHEWPATSSRAMHNNLVYLLRCSGNPSCQSVSIVIKGDVHW